MIEIKQTTNDYPFLSLGDAFMQSRSFGGACIGDIFYESDKRRSFGTNAFLHQLILFHNGDCHAFFVLAAENLFETQRSPRKCRREFSPGSADRHCRLLAADFAEFPVAGLVGWRDNSCWDIADRIVVLITLDIFQ